MRGFALYSVNAIFWGTVELEPEVEQWLDKLPARQFCTRCFLLAEEHGGGNSDAGAKAGELAGAERPEDG
jgi:hypothetical protein